ncbi:MAG: DUF1173 family protein [Gluconacetobacter sp.]|mgnify:CR=1 FL=1
MERSWGLEAMSRAIWLTFPGVDGRAAERMPYEWRYSRPDRFQACLERRHGVLPRPHCDCRHAGRLLELSVRGRQETRPGGAVRTVYHLACQKEEGPLHRHDCPFHGVPELGDADARHGLPASRVRDDGTIAIRLDVPLGLNTVRSNSQAGTQDHDVEADRRRSGARRGKATLLGLLWAIWETAGLSAWGPNQVKARFPRTLRCRLIEAVATMEVNRIPLAHCAGILFHNSGATPQDLQQLARASAGRSRVLLLGRLARSPAPAPTSRFPDRWRLDFDGASQCRLSVFIDAARLGRWTEHYPFAQRLLAGETEAPDAEVVIIATASLAVFSPEGDEPRVLAEVQDYALMETNAQMVPVASTPELQIANMLVAARRKFVRPLHYDRQGSPVHPDFILLDTAGRPMPMEVFGRDDEDYAVRAAEKRAHYDRLYGPEGWWQWDATRRGDPPPLPPPAQGR